MSAEAVAAVFRGVEVLPGRHGGVDEAGFVVVFWLAAAFGDAGWLAAFGGGGAVGAVVG